MTKATSGLDLALANIQSAIHDIPLDGFSPTDLADALLALSISVSEKLVDHRTIAKVHLGLAEQFFARAAQSSPTAASTPSADAHAILTAAVHSLRRRGHDDAVIRHLVLAFATAWVRQDEGPAGAETIYRHPAAIVARRPTSH